MHKYSNKYGWTTRVFLILWICIKSNYNINQGVIIVSNKLIKRLRILFIYIYDYIIFIYKLLGRRTPSYSILPSHKQSYSPIDIFALIYNADKLHWNGFTAANLFVFDEGLF